MVVSPAGLETKNYCPGEGQQQFTLPDPTQDITVCVSVGPLIFSFYMRSVLYERKVGD
jgi:hypothetical protein